MDPVVTEDWTKDKFVPDVSGAKEFEVSGVADAAEALAALLAATGGPGVGVEEGQAYPILYGEPLTIQKGGLSVTRKGRNFLIAAAYGKGTSGGGPAALLEKWDARIDWVYESIATVRDGAGVMIVNSVRDPISTGATEDELVAVIKLTRWETGVGVLAKALAYRGKVNTAALPLPIIGTAAIGEVILDSIEIVDNFKPSAAKVRVCYSLRAKPRIEAWRPNGSAKEMIHGFRRHEPDVATRAYRAGSGGAKEVAPIVWKTFGPERGRPPGFSVLMDGFGRPIDPSFGVQKITGSGSSASIDVVDAVGDTEAPTHYLTSPGNISVDLRAQLRGVTLLFDKSRGGANLNDLNLTANN